MLRVLIIDHSPLFREGLANLLQNEPGVVVVGSAGAIYEAAEMVRHSEPDIVLLDADLPEMQEHNTIRMLQAQRPQVDVVLLSAQGSEEQFLSAIRSGARGFVMKNQSISSLMTAIRAIERGEAVIPQQMARRLLDEFMRMSPPYDQDGGGLGALTRREMEVLRELGRGRSNRQIAENLAIAENTVKVHVHNILEKLNMRSRQQAAGFARRQGLANNSLSRAYAQPIA